ncbi:MAG: DUF421 domain-containing protein [Bacilli bacterium]|nr:DUF421 domain-containing protein [Bacilli bacterium]
MEYFIILFRSVFFYFLITILYRIMGKREIGELSIMDFIVSLFIAELVAISIENYKESILMSLIPVVSLALIQISLSYLSIKSKRVRNILDGNPSVIIENGKVNFKEMKKQRYNIEDLLMQLRDNSVKSINDIDYAVLETSGKLSIFKKNEDSRGDYPLPLILNGEIDSTTLSKINKNVKWLNAELEKQNLKLENVFYGFYQNNNLFIIESNKIK